MLQRCCVLLCLAVFLSGGNAFAQPKEPSYAIRGVQHVIDTHIHIYDTNREGGVPWPPKSAKTLYKPHLPKDFKKIASRAGVTRTLVVEASHWFRDNQWALTQTRGDGFYVGLVGNLDPNSKDFPRQLETLRKDKRFVGIRGRLPKQIDYADTTVVGNFRLLAKAKLSLDVLVRRKGIEPLNAINKLARTIPELHIVVNHALGVRLDGKPPTEDWQKAVKSLAQNKNVYCKVSGLFQRSTKQPAPKKLDFYRPVLDVLWREFGSKRLIYGSNWPVTKRSGSYADFLRLVDAYVSEKGKDARERYFWKNAVAAYRLKL